MKKQIATNKVLVMLSALFMGFYFGMIMELNSKYSIIFLFIAIGINSLHLLLPESNKTD